MQQWQVCSLQLSVADHCDPEHKWTFNWLPIIVWNIASIAKAAQHKLPGKSSLNVRFVYDPEHKWNSSVRACLSITKYVFLRIVRCWLHHCDFINLLFKDMQEWHLSNCRFWILRVVAHWWTLCESHLLRTYFGILVYFGIYINLQCNANVYLLYFTNPLCHKCVSLSSVVTESSVWLPPKVVVTFPIDNICQYKCRFLSE